ncbi:MAG: glutamate racemase [Thiopseudomonas sp.]
MHGQMPVGVFDSGLGGLSVLSEIHLRLPQESLIYVADSAYVPYGEKTAAQIVERSILVSEFLLDRGVKALIVACNTATAAAIQTLRERWPGLIVVGMEPAVKPAAQQSQCGKIGVLATTGTLRSARFAALLERYSEKVQVYTQPCPGLVERIEAGELASPATRELLAGYVHPLLAAGCDCLILGCTHYPFIKPLLRELVGDGIAIIDTGAAVARRLHCLLDEAGLLAAGPAATLELHTTGDMAAMQQALPALWPGSACVQELQL